MYIPEEIQQEILGFLPIDDMAALWKSSGIFRPILTKIFEQNPDEYTQNTICGLISRESRTSCFKICGCLPNGVKHGILINGTFKSGASLCIELYHVGKKLSQIFSDFTYIEPVGLIGSPDIGNFVIGFLDNGDNSHVYLFSVHTIQCQNRDITPNEFYKMIQEKNDLYCSINS